LQKTNDTSNIGVPRVSRAWGKTQFRPSHPARLWQHKIIGTLQYDVLLQLSNSKDKVFLLLLLKIYQLFCQNVNMI